MTFDCVFNSFTHPFYTCNSLFKHVRPIPASHYPLRNNTVLYKNSLTLLNWTTGNDSTDYRVSQTMQLPFSLISSVEIHQSRFSHSLQQYLITTESTAHQFCICVASSDTIRERINFVGLVWTDAIVLFRVYRVISFIVKARVQCYLDDE